MKNILKKISALLIMLALSAFATNTSAQSSESGDGQNYRTGIGARLGGLTSGLTVKHFTNPSTALEGIASFGYRSFVITGLYEKHRDISTAPGLKWFYGIGGHVGFFRYGGYYYRVKYEKNGYIYYVADPGSSSAVAGLDFILGMDYKFNNAPFNVGLDLKPFIDFFSGGPYGYWDGALSVRFAF
ncbi:MAG TPA: hypothetical protein VI757_03305 [Bacteroidia bacterium]|nr:hypothetical protein [Bacteroidia bacterium]